MSEPVYVVIIWGGRESESHVIIGGTEYEATKTALAETKMERVSITHFEAIPVIKHSRLHRGEWTEIE